MPLDPNDPPPSIPAQGVQLFNPDGTQTAAYREWMVKLMAWLLRRLA